MPRPSSNHLHLWLIILVSIVCLMPGAQAQTFSVIHDFTGGTDGYYPGPVTLDRGGKLYGSNSGGFGGEIFSLKPSGDNWLFNPLLTLTQGEGQLGQEPNPVTIGPNGSSYVSFVRGGQTTGPCATVGCGTVLNLKPPSTVCLTAICPWTPAVLHTFTGPPNDGRWPYGSLTFDAAGNLYGTTYAGGAEDGGTVYKLTLGNGGWTETILHSFLGGVDGDQPWGGVVFDRAANLYGTTIYGGTANLGTVYQLIPSGPGWTHTVLYNFPNQADGWWPLGSLIFDSNGNLYGTTSLGGAGNGGTVFELTPSGGNWTYHLVHALPGNGDKYGPSSTLAIDSEGNLYGTTSGGGAYDFGTLFKLTPSEQGWIYTDLHDFTGGEDGGNAQGPALDSSGNIFGAAVIGGHYECQGYTCGVIWEFAAN